MVLRLYKKTLKFFGTLVCICWLYVMAKIVWIQEVKHSTNSYQALCMQYQTSTQGEHSWKTYNSSLNDAKQNTTGNFRDIYNSSFKDSNLKKSHPSGSIKKNEFPIDCGLKHVSVADSLDTPLVSIDMAKHNEYLIYNPYKLQKDIPFLKNFKNPCFVEELTSDPYKGVKHDHRLIQQDATCAKNLYKKRLQTKENVRMRCLPYFFVAGVQKCGTTELHRVLQLHPQIMLFNSKENHWWNRARFGYTKREDHVTMEGYMNMFNVQAETILQSGPKTPSSANPFTHHLITGDVSPCLLWDQTYWQEIPENEGKKEPEIITPHIIADVLPRAKFLLILRNPTDRLYSDWLYFAPKGQSSTNYHRNVIQAISWFKNCTLYRPLRVCYYDPLTNDPYIGGANREKNPWWNPICRLRMSMYYIFIKDLLDVFPRDQVMVFRLEDYSKNRGLWLSKVFQFLELEPYDKIDQVMKKQRIYNQNNAGHKQKGPILPETEKILDDFFSSYNQKLAELLGEEAFLFQRN